MDRLFFVSSQLNVFKTNQFFEVIALLAMDWQPEKKHKVPLYKQIVSYIKNKITAGEWPAGTKLPPQRTLSQFFQVNRSTLNTALDELTADGFIDSRTGSGTWISHTSWSMLASHPPADWQRYVKEGSQPPNLSVIQAINQFEYASDILRLGTGELSPDFFPAAQLQKLLSSIPPNSLQLGYEQAKGLPALRQQLSLYLERLGIAISPSSILITSGALQAIQLIAHSLLPKGSGILLEKPSYLYSQMLFQALGSPLCGLPMDKNGLCLDSLMTKRREHQASFLYTIPCFHNPSGITMSKDRRIQLMTLCQKEQLPIIEDDVYRELWLDAPPPPPLKTLDKSGLVLYIGSFSKWLCPGLRIGWIAGPEPVINRLADVKMQYDYGASSLSQQAAAEWLSKGLLHSHLEQLRHGLRLRRDKALQLLSCYFSHLAQWNVPSGGFYIWLKLHRPAATEKLFKEALHHKLLLHPGLLYEPLDDTHLRLSYAFLPLESMDQAFLTLSQLIDQQ